MQVTTPNLKMLTSEEFEHTKKELKSGATGWIRGYDSYGRKINFTYNGTDEQVTTFIGGFISVIAAFCAYAYFGFQLKIMIENDKGVSFDVSDRNSFLSLNGRID